MAYSVEVAYTAAEFAPAEWDLLGQGALFSSHQWYSFAEKVLPNDKPIYLVVKSGEEPVARATFWLKTEDVQPVSSPFLYRTLNRCFSRRPMMICHSPLSNSSGLILPATQDRTEIFNLLMDEAVDIAYQEQASFLVLDYLPERFAKELTHRGVLCPLPVSEPGTVLHSQWLDFNDYLQHLSKNERKSYKRACRKADELGVEVRVQEHIDESLDKVIALVTEHDKTYHFSSLPWLESLLENHNMVDSFWVLAYVGEKLVGCELLLSDGDVWIATALGRDYDYPYVYFVMGYESISQVLSRGGKALRWGTGAYAYKQRLGFDLEDNFYVSFTAQNRFMDWLVRKIAPKLVI